MIYSHKTADCYDMFYQEKPYREEAAYAAGLIKARFQQAKTLFDLGCGTGLRSLELARLGFRVCGVDQSSAMLSAARRHLAAAPEISPSEVEFQTGDITAFRADAPRDGVVSLFHVFSYLTTLEALNQALECAFANLNTKGVFLFDYWHGPGVLKDPPGVRSRVVENDSLRAERTATPEHVPDKHLVKLTISLRAADKERGVSEDTEESYTMRYWFPEELEEPLKKSGFNAIRHYAWMTESTPGPDSWQACTIAVRA
jgi:SAM-dependent methyltransferase